MRELTGPVEMGREQRLAGGHWQLGAASCPRSAMADWADDGTRFLRPGARFGAIAVRAPSWCMPRSSWTARPSAARRYGHPPEPRAAPSRLRSHS
ncbi:hypothetical protein [Streptomyces californicus]|uniref:hypothetical protein n=1 Tax=Streptomyces californicus TaxID=67351 RepID=UPI003815BCC8